jgi:tellurite resistance protein TehA-like permease
MYFLLFTNRHHLKAASMTPAWMLPMFPVILTAPTAGIVAGSLDAEQAFSVHFCGILFMGLGLLMAIMSKLQLFAHLAVGLMKEQYWRYTSTVFANRISHRRILAQVFFWPLARQRILASGC